MSNVPSAVAKAEQEADRLQQELIEKLKQQQTPPGDPPVDPPPGDPQAEVPPPNQNDSQTPPPPQEENWEHRFKVLQGKYNSEVPRFANENKELKSRLESLEVQLEAMKNAKAQEPLVSQDEIDQYGEGLIDVARRIAREELMSKDTEIESLKRQIADISQTTTNTVRNDFFRSLSAMVPEWETLNTDPGFLKWLEEVDELTGETKQALLAKAEQASDAARVAKFFTSYKKTTSSWAANSNSALEQQVVPPTNKAPQTPPSKKVWTRPEITEFYRRMRQGLVSDADAVAIEADITAASVEGRIR